MAKTKKLFITLIFFLTLIPINSSPAHAAIGKYIAFLPPSTIMHEALSDTVSHAEYFAQAMPMLYKIDCGNPTIYSSSAPSPETVYSELNNAGIKAIPTVVSHMDARQMISCFSNPGTLNAHINDLVNIASNPEVYGLNIDYETFALSQDLSIAPTVRDVYTNFITQLCTRLHAINKHCTVDVFASTNGLKAAHVPSVYNYAALGSVADSVEIMAYDEHPAGGSPGPICGYPWYVNVLNYISTQIPARKAIIGLPLYGRDWNTFPKTEGVTVKNANINQLLSMAGSRAVYDPTQREVTFQYGTHVVWWPSPESVADRINYAWSRGFNVAFWAVGQETPNFWSTIPA